ncbi:MAG: PIN domain-containing protein [Acidimicrobiales bacterium]
MIVLDAYAVLALLKGEAAASDVRRLLEGAEPTMLTALGVAEVIDHLVRLVQVDDEAASLDLAQLGLLDPPALDAPTAAAAGRLWARRYHRTACAVSLADCVAAEVARREGARLATADPHLLDVCHVERIAVHALPATDGSTWSAPA